MTITDQTHPLTNSPIVDNKHNSEDPIQETWHKAIIGYYFECSHFKIYRRQ